MVSRKYCGGGIAILGVIVAVCGIVLYFLITHFQNVGIAGNKVLTRTSAAFSSWSSNENTTSQPPLYYSVYMFNMTNQDQVTQAGSKPIYEKKGPYVYREYQVRFDAEFIENDNAVSFYESKYYVFDREQTDPSLNPDTDVFINVNPGYMGIMQQTKQDLAVVVMFLNVILGYNIDLLKYSFVPDYLVNLSINGTSSSAYNLISQTSSSYFYDTWANNTNTNLPANWVDMTLSPGGLPSNISLSSAQKIFSADGYGLGNVSFPAARVWSNAMVNSTGKSLLMNEFGITEAQIDLVFSWLSRFAQNVVVPPLLTQYSIVDVTDLAWVQFALCNFFPGGVATFYNTHKIEACHVFGNNVTLAKEVVNGTHGLLQVSNTLEFFETYLSSGGAAQVAKMWDLNIATVYGMFGYLFSLTPYAKQYATDFINTNGGGIIVNRTVNEWLWNATDPLLEHIGQNSPVNLFTNDTSLDFVRNTTVRSIQYTGNNDTSLAQTYAQWNGTNTLSNIWNRPPAINGSEGFAFPSDLTETSQLWIFDDTTYRSGNLVYNQTVVNQGISLYRFYIDPKMLMPNPIYDQTIAGFANMTSVYQTPIFLCKPDFYQVAPGYASKVVISPAPTPGVNDEIYLDVEPQTGLTMAAWKQLQANIYVDPNLNLATFNPKFPTGTFFPIASAIEHSNITESLANTFKSQVYGSAKLKKGLLWGLLGFGVVLLLVGCMLVIFGEDKSYEQLY